MSEPAADHVNFDARFEEVNSGGVAKDVRADPAPGAWVVKVARMPANDLVDSRAGE